MAEDEKNYIATLQEEIERQKNNINALRSELNTDGGEEIDPPAAVVKKAITPFVPEYIKNISDLAFAADSESVRLSANKLLVEWAVTEKLVNGDLDADKNFKELLRALKKPVTKEK